MKTKRLLKKKAREAMEEKQARNVVRGIVIALLLLSALATIAYWVLT